MVRYKFTDLNQDELWKLRSEIVLNSLFVSDFRNSFGFDANSMCDFFDGYYDYLYDLYLDYIYEKGIDIPFDVSMFDNSDNLFDWYWHFDDFSWVKYDPEFTEEEEEKYCDYWNN